MGGGSIRERFRRREPANIPKGEKSFKEFPRRRVLHRVVAQPAERLVVPQVLERFRERLLFADEALSLPPRHDVHVRVYLAQLRRRVGARPRAVAADAAHADRRQLLQEILAHAVPRRREHREELAAGELLQRAEAIRDARQRGFDRFGLRIFGLLLAGGGAIAVIGAVLQNGDLRMQQAEQLRFRGLRNHRERQRDFFLAGNFQELPERRQHGGGIIVAPPARDLLSGRAPARKLGFEPGPVHAIHSRSSSALRCAPPKSTAPGAGRGRAAARSIAAASVRGESEASSSTSSSPLSASSVARSVCSASPSAAKGTSSARARACNVSSTVLYPA